MQRTAWCFSQMLCRVAENCCVVLLKMRLFRGKAANRQSQVRRPVREEFDADLAIQKMMPAGTGRGGNTCEELPSCRLRKTKHTGRLPQKWLHAEEHGHTFKAHVFSTAAASTECVLNWLYLQFFLAAQSPTPCISHRVVHLGDKGKSGRLHRFCRHRRERPPSVSWLARPSVKYHAECGGPV